MPCGNGDRILGYREFVKDYKIEYVDCPGRKRPKAVRVYVGPWFRFTQPPEKIRFLKWFYLIGLAVIALLLLIPMCIDCAFTRAWYIQVPAVVAWIPWIFAACATWRLWTAKERMDREHNALLGSRMNGSCLIMAGFCLTSFVGCVYGLISLTPTLMDYLISICCTLSSACAIVLFSRHKLLSTVQVDP